MITKEISKLFFTNEKGNEKTSAIVLTMPSVGVKTKSVLTDRYTPNEVINIVKTNKIKITMMGKYNSGII